jgi:predicted amidohydrolase
MESIIVACAQQRMTIQPSHEEFEAEARRFLRQAVAKAARFVIFPELTGVMVAPPLISSLKLGLVRREDEAKRPNAGLLSRTVGRLAGGTAGTLGGGFRGSLERLVRKRNDALLDAYYHTFGGLAREFGMIMVAGSLYTFDDTSGTIRNRAYVFDADGEVIGYQDKLNLAPDETDLASPGEEINVLDTRYGRMGLLIGRDVLFPELARAIALRGADLAACIAASPGVAQAAMVRSALGVRAEENQFYVAASFMLGPNMLGRGTREEFYGKSALLAPISLTPGGSGVLVEAGTDRTEALIAAELDGAALETLRSESRFRPRDEMHLGKARADLAEFYGGSMSLAQVVEQRLAHRPPEPRPVWSRVETPVIEPAPAADEAQELAAAGGQESGSPDLEG